MHWASLCSRPPRHSDTTDQVAPDKRLQMDLPVLSFQRRISVCLARLYPVFFPPAAVGRWKQEFVPHRAATQNTSRCSRDQPGPAGPLGTGAPWWWWGLFLLQDQRLGASEPETSHGAPFYLPSHAFCPSAPSRRALITGSITAPPRCCPAARSEQPVCFEPESNKAVRSTNTGY